MAATDSNSKERKSNLEAPSLYAWLFCVIGMSCLFAVAFLPDFGPLAPIKAVHLLLFRSVQATQILFVLAATAHFLEALYAWHLARKVDPSNSKFWYWQTFALGIFSLRFLLKKARMSKLE